MVMLGQACFTGEGVPQDEKEAVKWLQRAGEQGFGPAKQLLDAISK
jgi:TPR repeat protein